MELGLKEFNPDILLEFILFGSGILAGSLFIWLHQFTGFLNTISSTANKLTFVIVFGSFVNLLFINGYVMRNNRLLKKFKQEND